MKIAVEVTHFSTSNPHTFRNLMKSFDTLLSFDFSLSVSKS